MMLVRSETSDLIKRISERRVSNLDIIKLEEGSAEATKGEDCVACRRFFKISS